MSPGQTAALGGVGKAESPASTSRQFWWISPMKTRLTRFRSALVGRIKGGMIRDSKIAGVIRFCMTIPATYNEVEVIPSAANARRGGFRRIAVAQASAGGT